jgi:hypothetical protein
VNEGLDYHTRRVRRGWGRADRAGEDHKDGSFIVVCRECRRCEAKREIDQMS